MPADEFAVHLDRRAALAHCPREHADNPLREGDVRPARGKEAVDDRDLVICRLGRGKLTGDLFFFYRRKEFGSAEATDFDRENVVRPKHALCSRKPRRW